MNMKKPGVLILGATADTGIALAQKFIQSNYTVLLAARNAQALKDRLPESEDVKHVAFDARLFDTHEQWFNSLPFIPEITVCLFGYLGDQTKAFGNWSESREIIEANFTGAVSILNVVAAVYAQRKSGVIVGVSSVAGERGRQSNFIYGSSKAGFTAYLSGLRNHLFHHGVHVLTVKPGFMFTRMTAGMKLPAALTATPAKFADVVYSAIRARKNTVYVLWIWFWIMTVIRSIPEGVFKRLKL
jgi:short-subunit dehydrogenase